MSETKLHPTEGTGELHMPEKINAKPHQTAEDHARDELAARSKRDEALEAFRKNKVFGRFNGDFKLLAGWSHDNDAKFDDMLHAKQDYLAELATARKEGIPFSELDQRSSTAIAAKSFIKTRLRANGLSVVKAATWLLPGKAFADIAGALWDAGDFGQVRNLIILTEHTRQRIINEMNKDIAAAEAPLKDKEAEAKAHKKDEALAAQIRANLRKTGANNDKLAA